MTKAFQILAGILALLGTLLIHNYPVPGFIFYAFAITSYFASLLTHRKEEQSKQNAEKSRLQLDQEKQQTDKEIIMQKYIDSAVEAWKHDGTAVHYLNSLNIPNNKKSEILIAASMRHKKRPPKNNPYT